MPYVTLTFPSCSVTSSTLIFICDIITAHQLSLDRMSCTRRKCVCERKASLFIAATCSAYTHKQCKQWSVCCSPLVQPRHVATVSGQRLTWDAHILHQGDQTNESVVRTHSHTHTPILYK
ncbi:hypothetical protein J6590_045705 [Homalodisca vitripennis]|nr:hypothetical protein J6590_045705 [Homalodisca vitripennis]